MHSFPKAFIISKEISRALSEGQPIVALESTVITHGLPYPQNLNLAMDLESEVRNQNAIPATIGVIDGQVRVGLEDSHLEILSKGKDLRKISVRDFAPAIARNESGGTTVAGTLVVAENIGIRILATGGIGGVHREEPFDVSTDLTQLAHTPIVVVCSGAKSILDLPATLERLETLGIPVIGYQTDEFPAFYSRESGLPVTINAESEEEIAEIAKTHWGLGLQSAILVAVPPPQEAAVPSSKIESAIHQAIKEAKEKQIRGQGVTPFLLQRVSELTEGDSLKANLGLLKNNASTAAKIAHYLYKPKGTLSA